MHENKKHNHMNTKLIIASFATAAIALVSCSKNEIFQKPSQATEETPIEFTTYLPVTPDMKGAVTSTTTIQAASAGFGVNAAYTGQTPFASATNQKDADFMYNQQVLYGASTGWTYTPLKYWPTTKDDKVSFFAYAPYKGAGIALCTNATDQDASTLKFSIQPDPKNTVDFVAAGAIDRIGGDAPTAVSFSLKHELTRVSFAVKASEQVFDDSDAAKKTKLVIREVKLSGTETEGLPTGKVPSKSLYTTADYTYADAAAGDWSDYVHNKADYDLKSMIPMSKAVVGSSSYGEIGFSLENGTLLNLFNNGEYLFLIPVNGSTGTSTLEDIVLMVTYDIVTADAPLLATYSCTTSTKYVGLPVGTLKQGHSYKFTLTLDVDSVAMSATVEDKTDGWGMEDEETGDMSGSYTDPI